MRPTADEKMFEPRGQVKVLKDSPMLLESGQKGVNKSQIIPKGGKQKGI